MRTAARSTMSEIVWEIVRPAVLLSTLLMLAMIAPAAHSQEDDPLMARFERMVRYNLDNPHVVPSATIDSLARAFEPLPVGERVAAWADWFSRQGGARYVYGRDPGGYVTEGRLCDDFAVDCVLFVYRMTELARSASAVEAVQFAFGTRLYGASVEEAIAEDGRVVYDVPAHLDFAEDMLRSGIWGEDVTRSCGEAVLDAIGSSRVPPDTLHYVPRDRIDASAVRDGDIVWMVGDEAEPGALERRRVGTLIHHMGVARKREDGAIDLIHAAARPLPGIYEQTGVVRVPLETYLDRVGRFKGIVVTRLKEF